MLQNIHDLLIQQSTYITPQLVSTHILREHANFFLIRLLQHPASMQLLPCKFCSFFLIFLCVCLLGFLLLLLMSCCCYHGRSLYILLSLLVTELPDTFTLLSITRSLSFLHSRNYILLTLSIKLSPTTQRHMKLLVLYFC